MSTNKQKQSQSAIVKANPNAAQVGCNGPGILRIVEAWLGDQRVARRLGLASVRPTGAVQLILLLPSLLDDRSRVSERDSDNVGDALHEVDGGPIELVGRCAGSGEDAAYARRPEHRGGDRVQVRLALTGRARPAPCAHRIDLAPKFFYVSHLP